jgi:hypothetical protein
LFLSIFQTSVIAGQRYIMNPHTGKLDAVESGVPGLTCAITGGSRSIVYDEVGLNPSPDESEPFSFVLMQGTTTLAAASQSWTTGIGVFSGSGNAATFIPTIATDSNALPGANHYVQVVIVAAGGLGSCTASVPAAVTKIGPQGLPGDAEYIEPNVMSAFAATGSDSKLVLKGQTAGVVKLEVQDSAANPKIQMDSAGNLVVRGSITIY